MGVVTARNVDTPERLAKVVMRWSPGILSREIEGVILKGKLVDTILTETFKDTRGYRGFLTLNRGLGQDIRFVLLNPQCTITTGGKFSGFIFWDDRKSDNRRPRTMRLLWDKSKVFHPVMKECFSALDMLVHEKKYWDVMDGLDNTLKTLRGDK